MTDPETYDHRKALMDDRFTEGEKQAIRWQHDMLGGFKTLLWDAMKSADPDNLERFRAGFPDEVQGLEAYRTGALAHKATSLGYRRLF